jgi:hypothetical protein
VGPDIYMSKLSSSTGMNTLINSNSVTGYFLKCIHVGSSFCKTRIAPTQFDLSDELLCIAFKSTARKQPGDGQQTDF